MFLSAIVSFLGGSAFRFIINGVTEWLQKRQEHLQELQRIQAQEAIDQARHVRQLEMIRLQSDLKLTEVKLIGEAAVSQEEAKAFTAAMDRVNAPTGFRPIDAWNGSIRPLIATVAALLWILKVVKAGLVITQWDSDLMSAVFGYYFADRHIGKSKQ